MQQLLSICILTYNRAMYLQDALNSLFSQDQEFKEDIEIIVSDNASTGNTSDFIKTFRDKAEFMLFF